ncbi:MAG: hypothetical protein RL236_1811 [Pseudomonadota bacterium]|jgi:uncharacterized protein with HEPN domain
MSIENLQIQITLLEKQLFWLNYSYQQVAPIDLNTPLEIETINHYENLCSRFSRTIDFLIRKVFRAIDAAEFETQGTLIDTINKAHKRQLFESIEVMRDLKDLRNEIVHEYIDDALEAVFVEVRDLTPALIQIVNNTLTYAKRLLIS